MTKTKFFMVVTVAISSLIVGAFTDTHAASAKPDSVAVIKTTQPSQSKQTSVQKTTKKTNWSKIKTLFE